MSGIWRQAVKDLRRFKWLLGGYAAAAALFHVMQAESLVLLGRGWMTTQSLAYAQMVLSAIVAGAMVAMAVVLVQEDPPVGTTAFWLTRPLSGSSLLLSKILVAVVAFVLLPIVFSLFAILSLGLSPSAALRLVPGMLVQQAVVLLPVLALAVITPNLAQFVTAALLAVLAFCVVVLGIRVMAPRGSLRASEMVVASRSVISVAFPIVAGAIVLVHQYLTRKTPRSIALTAVSVPLLGAMVLAWPWSIVSPPDKVIAPLRLEKAEMEILPTTSARTGGTIPARGTLRFLGLPPDVVVVASGPGTAGDYAVGIRSAEVLALVERLTNARVMNPDEIVRSSPVSDLVLRPVPREPRPGEGGSGSPPITAPRYTATVQGWAYRYWIGATPAQRVGEAYLVGARRGRVARVERSPGAFTVTIDEVGVVSELPGRPLWILHNRARNEVIAGASSVMNAENALAILPTAGRLATRRLQVEFGTGRYVRFDTPVDDAWLAGARLMLITDRYLGEFTKTIEVTLKSDGLPPPPPTITVFPRRDKR
jgi:hypothetical protein